MVPSAIGVPVAFCPGLVPQSDDLTAPVPAEPPLDVLVGFPLLPQPTRVAIPTAAMRATKGRACATRPYIRSCLSTSCGDGKKSRPSWARCADARTAQTGPQGQASAW